MGKTETKSGKTNFRNPQETRSAEDELFATAAEEGAMEKEN